jgi:hypothetical protein
VYLQVVGGPEEPGLARGTAIEVEASLIDDA